MFTLWSIGRQMSQKRDAYLLSRHRGIVACVGCLTTLAVLLIELQVRLSPMPATSSPIVLAFHLGVVAMLVAVFAAIVLKWRGIEHPRMHRRLAYSFFGLYAFVIASGGVLLYRLPA